MLRQLVVFLWDIAENQKMILADDHAKPLLVFALFTSPQKFSLFKPCLLLWASRHDDVLSYTLYIARTPFCMPSLELLGQIMYNLQLVFQKEEDLTVASLSWKMIWSKHVVWIGRNIFFTFSGKSIRSCRSNFIQTCLTFGFQYLKSL